MSKNIIFIFDRNIHTNRSCTIGKTIVDEPVYYVRDLLIKLRSKGYMITIMSERCNYLGGHEAIEKWLYEHDIPVDDVCDTLPSNYCMIVDCLKEDTVNFLIKKYKLKE